MPTILFLCPHNAAKGILAEAYFNHRVPSTGSPFQADSAGTEPDDQIWPSVVALLAQEGIALPPKKIPRRVMSTDLRTAYRVISMGCAVADLANVSHPILLWDAIPLASVDLAGAWAAIRVHVDALITGLAATIQA